jgi:hypothetical protein
MNGSGLGPAGAWAWIVRAAAKTPATISTAIANFFLFIFSPPLSRYQNGKEMSGGSIQELRNNLLFRFLDFFYRWHLVMREAAFLQCSWRTGAQFAISST